MTDRSSLATTELWTWHVSGGAGLRLTRREKQSEVADPFVAPDGRFVFYANRDARYRYDDDVDRGIWQIDRLDRRTGEATPLTGEHGGARADAVSDGRQLAFVRRVRGVTRIEVLDLATGRARLVADAVQRDQQEGFAFHGVFPGMAWTPDGRSLVANAEGRLFRWDVADGTRTPHPPFGASGLPHRPRDPARRTPARRDGAPARPRAALADARTRRPELALHRTRPDPPRRADGATPEPWADGDAGSRSRPRSLPMAAPWSTRPGRTRRAATSSDGARPAAARDA